jgi:HlyD family secretion protein
MMKTGHKNPRWTGLGLAALLLSSVAACSGGEGAAEAQTGTASTDAPRTVRVARIESRPLEAGLAVSGLLVAREEAAVGTEIAGYRISRVLADEGQYVRRGQTLAVLDPTLINADVATQRAQAQRANASVAQAQSALAEAQVRAAQAQGEAQRVAGLDGQGVLSQEAIEARRSAAASARAAVGSAQAAVNAARADAAAAQAQLRQVQTRLSRTSIASPVDGMVLERNARPGEVSGGAAQPLFRIARGGLVELDAEVPEAQLAQLSQGQPAEVILPSGGTVVGNIRYIDPTVDPQTRLGRARIALPPRQDLRPGGFARARISNLSAPGKLLPEGAVQFDAGGAYVMVVGANNRVRRVNVRTGRRANGFVEIVQGPPEGALVLLSGAAFIVEGDVVRPILNGAAPQRAAAPAAPRAAQATQPPAAQRPAVQAAAPTPAREGAAR